MHRIQIQFTEDQARSLKRISSHTGRSVADIVRECVDAHLLAANNNDRQRTIDHAKEAAGRFSSGQRDISSNHDKYLAEDFEA
jgi:predicted DNA-binding protein